VQRFQAGLIMPVIIGYDNSHSGIRCIFDKRATHPGGCPGRISKYLIEAPESIGIGKKGAQKTPPAQGVNAGGGLGGWLFALEEYLFQPLDLK
jgi:hypothetical protein